MRLAWLGVTVGLPPCPRPAPPSSLHCLDGTPTIPSPQTQVLDTTLLAAGCCKYCSGFPPYFCFITSFIEIQFPGLKFPKVNVIEAVVNIPTLLSTLRIISKFWEPAGWENAAKQAFSPGRHSALFTASQTMMISDQKTLNTRQVNVKSNIKWQSYQ